MQQESTPLFDRLLYAIARLRPRWKIAFFFLGCLFLFATFSILGDLNKRFLTEVPDFGGKISEGIIGRPRFINPVLAKSDADRDMTQLIFSGLLQPTPEGNLAPNLAREYSISDDGLTYTFILKNGLTWHDGQPITAEDVVFTIEKVQDKSLAIKSPRRASWDDVSVTTTDTHTVVFTLKQPYAPFLENATMGIIPKHIWQNIPNEEFDVSFYNVEPIGSGPYKLKSIIHDEEKGLPIAYELQAFSGYALGEPYISNLTIRFYGNNDELVSAYNQNIITQIHTVDPQLAQSLETRGAFVTRTELPRVFAAFFNQQNNPALADKIVREALREASDRERIIRDVLHGYGKTIVGPLPYEIASTTLSMSEPSRDERIMQATEILEKAGWRINSETNVREKVDTKTKKTFPLSFSIAVPDVEELRKSAEYLKDDWERIGADVEVKVYELSTFAVEVLAPRQYDILFYGQVIGRSPDLFPYWHSSQRTAPGLNVAQYNSKPADKLLEELRKTNDHIEQGHILEEIYKEIENDIPAVFVYSPYFLYVRDNTIRGGKTGLITTESERFLDIAQWYIESDYVWNFFTERFKRNSIAY